MSNPVLSSPSTIFQQTQQKVVSPTVNGTSNDNTTTTATKSTPSCNNKRVKVTLACIVCRKKKVKCDGIQPTCSRCSSMGFSCEYSDPPKKRGPPKGQVEIIESRAHRIESLRAGVTVASMKHNNNQHDHKTTSTVYSVPMVDGLGSHTSLDQSIISKNETSNKKLLSLEKNIILHLISGAVDAIKPNRWSLHLHPHHQNKPGSHYLKNDFFMKDDPMVNKYQKWISCYFGYFNVFFPVLSQAHFMREFSQQQVDPLLCYAVCALGSKYSDDGQDNSRFFFERCQYILNAPCGPTTLPTVQALVILCWYSYLLGNMQICCELRRLLNQAVRDLQLHRDPGSSFGIVSIEMRRRAFWVAFVIDQWLSCCTDERFLVLQEGWNCQWPRLEDTQLLVIDSKQWKSTTHNSSNNDDMIHQQHQPIIDSSCYMPDLSTEYALQITAFSEMIKLACIVGDMHDLHTPSSTSLLDQQQSIVSRLTDWLLRLPPYLEYGKPRDDSPPSPIARIYHMLYYTVQIMIHQSLFDHLHQNQLQQHSTMTSTSSPHASPPSSLLSPTNSNCTSVTNMSRTICINAASTIVHIAEQMIQYKQQTYLHNTFMVSLTLASSVQLHSTLNTDNISSILNLDKSFQVLKNCNCSVLESQEFGQLLDRYLLDHYGIQFRDKNLEQQQQQQQTPYRRLSCAKRALDSDYRNANRASDVEDDTLFDTPRKRRTQQNCINKSPHTLDSAAVTDSQVPISPGKWIMDTITTNINDNKDDLLDTRLYSLLHSPCPYTATNVTISSPLSTGSNPATTVLDPTWLDETSTILDLFSDTTTSSTSSMATSSPPLQYQHYGSSSGAVTAQSHRYTPIDSWQSPASFVSPTQSPTLSSDSNIPTVVTPMTNMSYYSGDDCDTDYFESSGALFYPATTDAMKLYDFLSDATFVPSYIH